MRALLPEPTDSIDVHQTYAQDWIDRGGIRANMISAVDGAAAADGLTAGLQAPGDKTIFDALRDLADVVLVGWSTARAEKYSPLDLDEERVRRRAGFGLPARLPLALVTRSLSIPADSRLLATADTLVVTCAAADPTERAALAERVEVLVCGEDEIDYGAVRREFADRGLTRVLCEGGPTILSQVIAAGELDELCLTLTPLLAGPDQPRIVAGGAWAGGPRRLRLHGLLEESGALFARYARAS